MSQQHYANHRRYYPPHHFIFLPFMSAMTFIGVFRSIKYEEHSLEWLLFGILSFCILYLAIMLRQHYALGNQNRIVRLEFRLRYFELTGTSSKATEEKLRFGQIAALRFADDQQFLVLLNKAVKEKLSATDIKKSITNWQADLMRV